MSASTKPSDAAQAPGIIPSADERPVFVNRMFARIAPTYDLMNRLMTFGQDQGWRRKLLEACALPPQGTLLDIGTGTGDIAYAALQQYPGITAVGSDFTYEMMAAGVGKTPGLYLPFVQGDTFALPFPDDTFDAVVSGFMVRNVVDRVGAFREMARVTKPGGRVACLEIAPPTNALLEPFFRFYFFRVVPLIGGLISGDSKAYSYLPHSTVEFPPPDALARLMEQAGLSNVVYREYMIKTVAIHAGTKLKNTVK
jgi:demethylmenaquinone methyltransferase/2-methoxy-6-polyprenyl-1,4-benzoquinol methylase